jgi:hypothetical protein
MTRSKSIALAIIGIAVQFSTPAHASFALKLNTTGLSDSEIAAVSTLLKSVEAAVPEKIKTTIGYPIEVEFKDLEDLSLRHTPLKVDCQADGSEKFAIGKAVIEQARGGKLLLNSRILPEIEKGPEASRTFNCGHKTFYNLARANLIHELGHHYHRRVPISDNLQYRTITGWKTLSSGASQKNTVWQRSPDPYEFKSPEESFAVNLEFFLTDPEFRCRRPALYRFFSRELQTIPFPENACEINRTVYVTSLMGERAVQLDPSRVYEVQYLQAAPGNTFDSSQGHSMIKLAVCSPLRRTIGPECLQDFNHHLVISYQASINDVKVDIKKSLNGGYPSQLFIVPFNEILVQYSTKELRDLKAIPIDLNPDSKEDHLDQIVERFWSYRGKYKFLSENCATETHSLFDAAVIAPHPIQQSSPVSPKGLMDLITTSNLENLNRPRTMEEQIRQGYFFPSQQRNRLESAFHAVRPLIPQKYQNTLQFLETSSADERATLYRQMDEQGVFKTHPEVAANFYLLEMQIFFVLDRRFQKEFAKLIETQKAAPNTEVASLLRNYQNIEDRLLPWNRVKSGSGYGIPKITEVDPCVQILGASEMETIQTQLSKLLPALLPDVSKEIDQTSKNGVSLFEKLSKKS